jgi:hypothetical protein
MEPVRCIADAAFVFRIADGQLGGFHGRSVVLAFWRSRGILVDSILVYSELIWYCLPRDP